MKLTVKTLKGTTFDIVVQPSDTIMAVKKHIEAKQGKDNYPCGQQLLIHCGKVLKDESTLAENKVSEDGFLVVMLSKTKPSTVGTSSSTQVLAAPAPQPTPQSTPQAEITEAPPQAPAPTIINEPRTTEAPTIINEPRTTDVTDVYGQAASSLLAGANLEPMVQQLMEMGGGNWDKDTVTRALRAAYNNPERAVEYLYSGIPEPTEVAVPVAHVPSSQATNQGSDITPAATGGASTLSGLPNSSPLNMFPEEIPATGAGAGGGSLDFLRNNPQFQALRAMVQANPQILQPMLQELSRQNPNMLRLIQEHHAEFLQLLNEPVEDAEGDLLDQSDQEMPHAINVTPAEQEAIARLEAMGFDRGRVIEAFLACDRNEELAANYLLENAGDED